MRGGVDVQWAIIHKAAFIRRVLRDLQGEAIDAFLGLSQSDIAGTDKHVENIAQAVFLDSVLIEFCRFIVERGHQIFAGAGQRSREVQSVIERLRERVDEVCEILSTKGSGTIKNRALQVILERNLASFKRGDQHLVPIFEIQFVQLKMLQGTAPLGTIPPVAQQHAAYVPENGANLRQGDEDSTRRSNPKAKYSIS